MPTAGATSQTGAAGSATPPTGPGVNVSERCQLDLGAVDSQASLGYITESLTLDHFAGWNQVPGNGLPDAQTLMSKPAAASQSSSSAHLFARSASEGLWQNYGVVADDGDTWIWLGWSRLRTPPAWAGGVSATAFGTHGLALAAKGAAVDGTYVYFRACLPAPGGDAGEDGVWSDWALVSSRAVKRDPAIAFGAPNLFIVALDTNDQFNFSTNPVGASFDANRWSPFRAIPGGPWASEAGVAARPDGKVFVAALSRDGQYYLTKSLNAGESWSPWKLVDSGLLRFASAPALASAPTAGGSLSIFGTGVDEQMWRSTSTDDGLTWGSFDAPPAARLITAPAAVSPTEGVVHTFGLGTDFTMFMNPYHQ